MNTPQREAVVLLHGLWVGSWAMGILMRRLQRDGYHCYRLSYATVSHDLQQNAARLNEFLGSVKEPMVNFVAHSLGGVLVRALFHYYPDQRPGRIVMLGTPSQPSEAARRMSRLPLLRKLAGRSLAQFRREGAQWGSVPRTVGVVAGSLPIGAGVLVGGLPRPNDGAVRVEETRATDLADHIVLPVSHSGLLCLKSVYRQVLLFLKSGRFDHGDV